MSIVINGFNRVLVTGAGGVLGTAVKSLLEKAGTQNLYITRDVCDLTEKSEVLAVFNEFKPDLVLHLAGKVFGVQGNKEFCGEVYYDNIMINTNVIEASRRAGVKKIVVAGTAAIYSDIAPLPMSEDDFWFGPPHGSEGPYANAKRAMLAQLEAYKIQYNMDFAYLILTNLYGENDRFDEQFGHVVPSLIKRFVMAKQNNTKQIICWGDGSPTRDFLYSKDAAEAFLYAAERGNGVYNVATGKSISIKELVETIAKVTNYEGDIIWDTTKPLGQLVRSYNVDRIKSIGWQANTKLYDGISYSCEWFSTNIKTSRT